MGRRSHMKWITQQQTSIIAALSLCCLASLAQAGVDSNGQDWGILTKTRAELLPPPPAPVPGPCAYINPNCDECSGNICTACSLAYDVSADGKSCVCKKGSSPSQDGSTCILDGVVNVGKKVYNDPQVQAGLQETQLGIQKAADQLFQIANKQVTNANTKVSSFISTEAKKVSTNLQAALAPTGLKLAPLPQPQPVVSGAQAPSAMPGMAVAGMPSATMPTQDEISLSKQAYYAQGPYAEGPALDVVPEKVVSLQQLYGQNAQTTPLQPIDALLSRAGGLLPSLLPGLGRRMLRAEQ